MISAAPGPPKPWTFRRFAIDDEAQAYLPHMFGASNYAVIEEAGKLPCKVSGIEEPVGLR